MKDTVLPNGAEKTGRLQDPDSELRALVSGAIHNCRKSAGGRSSRLVIAQELTARLGQRVTVAMLNDWTAEAKKPARFPACFIRDFSEIAKSDAIQLAVMSNRQRHLLKLGEEAERHGERLQRQKYLLDLGEKAEQLILTASRKRKKV